jgi:hypothetical protein
LNEGATMNISSKHPDHRAAGNNSQSFLDMEDSGG